MKLSILSCLISACAFGECIPHKAIPGAIPEKRIVNGVVEKCTTSGKWVQETGEALYTAADLEAAMASAHKRGYVACVDEVEKTVSAEAKSQRP